MDTISTLAIDLASRVFQLHGVNERGQPLLRKTVSRAKLGEAIAKIPPCLIVMEACGSSNYWARRFQSMGHQVKLISANFVKPFVKGNKNDRNDAEAIYEASARPTMRFVPIKSIEQQDIQTVHRVRSLLMKDRNATINQIRGLLAEYGILVPHAAANVRHHLPGILEDASNALTPLARNVFADLYDRLVDLEERVARYEQRIQQLFKASPICRKIERVRGVGPLIATAIVATAGDGKEFRRGRQFAAWLGLVPRQHSTGGKPRLLGISKRGDKYLRTLLIHGARAVVAQAQHRDDSLSRWINGIKARAGANIAAVALANKNARIIWALLRRDTSYEVSS
jgi:transposase